MRYENAENFKETCGYEINGVWYPRVTKILEIKNKPALEMFFKEMDSYSSAEEVKNKSAVEGSLIHEIVGKLLLGEKTEIPERIRPAIDAVNEFRETWGMVFHPDFIERRVWSARQRYAGTVDALASFGGKFGVLDIKTSAYFYSDYNLQTAAYVNALQEFEIKRALSLPKEIETRWILRVDQHKICRKCGAKLREKGGRSKIRNGKSNGVPACPEAEHEWGNLIGEVEIKEFPYLNGDTKAFLAAKTLWEWENDYWLRRIGYLKSRF